MCKAYSRQRSLNSRPCSLSVGARIDAFCTAIEGARDHLFPRAHSQKRWHAAVCISG